MLDYIVYAVFNSVPIYSVNIINQIITLLLPRLEYQFHY